MALGPTDTDNLRALERDFFPSYGRAIRRFDPAKLLTDPERLQFKSGGDKHGVTKSLRIGEWEEAFSGIAYVWRSKEGRHYIADGHQRLGEARRLRTSSDGSPIRLNGFLFREKDGWTIEMMRVYAAAKNIAEGGDSTKAMDVAKLLRNGGPVEFLDQHVSSQRKCYRDGKALANLSGECFGLVLNNVIPESWGVAIGAQVKDAKEQIGIAEYLMKHRPRADSIFAVVAEAVATGFVNVKQTNLFGDADFSHALIAERIQVYGFCQRELRERAEALGGALKKADEFLQCGTELNGRHEQQRALRRAMHDQLPQARMRGDLSEALTMAARMYQGNRNMAIAANFFLAELEAFSRPFVPKFAAAPKAAAAKAAADEPMPMLPMAMPLDTGAANSQPGLF